MFAINALSFLNRSLSTKIRAAVVLFKHVRHNSYRRSSITSFDVKSKVENDVTLFQFEDPKYFIFINFFSVAQCAFWTYLGLFVLQDLKKSSVRFEGERFWTKVLDKERKYSDILRVTSLIFGWSIFVGTILYSLRSIRKIILHKGGNYVTIVTYNLPGFDSLKVPLNNVSSFQHRTKAKKYIPIKIKNKYFYYLVDVRGQFSNPTLFDFTAGLKRTF